MSANPGLTRNPMSAHLTRAQESRPTTSRLPDDVAPVHGSVAVIDKVAHRVSKPLSPWSHSLGKRLFDLVSVSAALPVVMPVLFVTGLAVRLTSSGPVLFRQQRMGRNGQAFTILKFRTMPVRRQAADRPAVTTSINQRFTPVGRFLRRWKLDELPQIINVLRGDMSLVGPRPKLPKHQPSHLNCRPGITGRATMVFALEEVVLSKVPTAHLDTYYHGVVLPFKQKLDDEYMARATFSSDLNLIWRSILRKWDHRELTDLLSVQAHPEPPQVQTRVSVERTEKTNTGQVLLPARPVSINSPLQES